MTNARLFTLGKRRCCKKYFGYNQGVGWLQLLCAPLIRTLYT